ncbi:FecR family protein [Chitinophaga tropicalis]|uniref:DUF4974 domain-containing protein n=1 Tax=Chitinophaga tropicalis TaxID=2683588 RepID=A0A7K1U945_9BACT|nr:FecR domain-containing protein [Chitinophaga tropicalis]MVT10897.1 DUF4974 domain-containing protein [Chitinophaga tropicalis]
MKISSQLLEKYFKGLCTDEEAELVAAWLEDEGASETDAWFEEKKREAEEEQVTGKGKVRTIHPGYGVAAAVLVLMSLLGWLWQQAGQRSGVKMANLSDTIRNNSNTIRLVHMADGSKIWLNAYSTIIYKKNFSVSNRDLWLNGEAYFEVGKNADFPFRVHTAALITTALGTSFNIATGNKADGSIQVSLLEGKVAVTDTLSGGSFHYVLEPGQMLEYKEGLQPAKPYAFNKTSTLDWKNYKVIFDRTLLTDAFALLESRYNCRISIGDTTLRNRMISGSFSAAQPVSSILDALGYVHSFSYTFDERNNHYTIKRK